MTGVDESLPSWPGSGTRGMTLSFAFDRTDRLVGLIRCPAATLHPNVLLVYITTLARECDRFEYVLTGADRF